MMLGRSSSGFHRLGRHCVHQARSAVSCLASLMKSWAVSYEVPLVRRTSAPCAHFVAHRMEAPNELICFPMRPFSEKATEIHCTYLVGSCALRYIIPVRGGNALRSARYDLSRPPSRLPPTHKNEKKKRYRGGVAHRVRGVIYGVVDNRH